MKYSLLACALLAAGIGMARAEAVTANGLITLSIKASGNLVDARRIARERAENDAVLGLLKRTNGADVNSPTVINALPDLRKQLIDRMHTTFVAEGDALSAKTVLEVDSAEFSKLVMALGVTSKVATAKTKVLFLIDEYYGVGTRLDPAEPLVTSVEYSHDKSGFSDHTATASGARSASSASASASKSSQASASSEKNAFAASAAAAATGRDKGSFSGSDRQSFNGADQRAMALRDGAGGAASGAASTNVSGARDTRAEGARDTSFAGSQKSAAAGSTSLQTAQTASSSQASAAKSASAASFASRQNAVERQNDIVSLKIRQVFPGIDNAKPADLSAAMIAAKLQQVVTEYGIAFTDERDFRVDKGRRLTNVDIVHNQMSQLLLKKAAQGAYNAKYLVYGTALMNSEGTTPSGQIACSGMLSLSSASVDTGEGMMAGTIAKRAVGSSDQNCRAVLSEAMARSLADTVGTAVQQAVQQAATRGRSYVLALHSGSRVPAKLRRFFSDRVKAIEGVVEVADDETATEGLRRWNVVAKGNFGEKVEDLIDEIAEMDGSAYQAGRFEQRGNRMIFCIDGKCPAEI